MLKKGLSILQYVFFLGLGVGLLWYSASKMSDEQYEQLKESFRQTNYLYLIPVMFILIASHYARALRWKILMTPMGFSPTKANVFFAVMIL